MKKFLITDFLDKDDDHFPREYLELPIFKKNFTLNEKDILFRKWKNYKIKISERKKNFELYEYFLTELTKFLNDYHKKNYSKRN